MAETPVPLTVQRALRISATHPAVRDVRLVTRHKDGSIWAELDVEQELPSTWRAAGVSPSGVQAVETVTIRFPPDFPRSSPRAFLRETFDRAHPHLLPVPKSLGLPPQPCVVQAYPSELIQARGFSAYLDQLAEWLDKAAMLELNNPRHGWEPVRRDHLDDEIILDPDEIRELAVSSGEYFVVETNYLRFELGDDKRTMRVAIEADHRVDLATAKCSEKALSKVAFRGRGIALVVSAPDTDGLPTVINRAVPEDVETVQGLQRRAELYRCRTALMAKLDHVALMLDNGQFPASPLPVVFLVRRPFPLVGSSSNIEICPYLIDLRPGGGLLRGVGDVRLCGVRDDISIKLLRRASGDPVTAERPRWALLGCGSVGSKIAVHAARRGLGPTDVIDRALMSPHNYARHALLPDPDVRGGVVGYKADVLAQALSGFQQQPRVEVGTVEELCGSERGRAELSKCRLVVNTTGSSLLREVVSSLNWPERPIFADAHLLGAGSIAYAAFEGPNGNPSLSDLAAESYRILARDEALRAKVFDAEAQAIDIGQGCGAVTFPMPDDRLGALAAGLCQTVCGRLLDQGQRAAGSLHLGHVLADGLSQRWTSVDIEPRIVVTSGDLEVRISPRVDAEIRSTIAAQPGAETGGVIVGRYSQIGDAFQIVDLLPAPPDSVFSAERFVLGVEGLRGSVRRLLEQSGGSLYVLGTWHSHLVPSGPSVLDIATATRLAVRQHFPVLMLIAHPDGYSVLAAELAGHVAVNIEKRLPV
ncbi:ThiF family adenylyltransferase [Xanthobacter autotrophicus]|uniref:ThiF family adenylyltransferase n=1 Tax=Xanthobacter autotrophicus TaxID=280 RepID=UPI001E299F0F|nr:ThiF family adenylyltransferase [Xanthobacter autotrophicus]UDQ91705.1 ThiF family adenylyltransferase [Xanthobacter autotrophicus]